MATEIAAMIGSTTGFAVLTQTNFFLTNLQVYFSLAIVAIDPALEQAPPALLVAA
jgi:hypothetical protein